MVAAIAGPTRSGDRLVGSTCLISHTAAPRMAGTAISKLKPTAQVRDSPKASAAAIVSPLRLTPGNGANIWARPIKRASSQVVSAGPFVPVPPLSHAVSSKTAAVIKKPTPANAIPSNVFSIIFLRKSASGISGEVATAASNPTRTTSGRRNPAGDVVGTQQSAQALGDGPAIMDQDRGRRPQVEDHVEEQVFLAGLGDTRQPGEEILREQQVAVARDGQEFGDPLHDAQNQ